MSARGGRKRGRPPKTPNNGRVVGKFNYQLLKKPKYLSKVCDSQESTPSVSRATSPQESDGSRGIQRKSFGKGRPGRGRKANSGHFYTTRRGYESEYHYGSDFGDSSDNKSDVEEDIIFSPSEDESLDKSDSASDFSVGSFSQSLIGRPPRPPSPDPVWLQGRQYPALELPDSSEDLIVDTQLVLRSLGVYEVLRRFRHLVRLSPFRFEDFCAALACEEQSVLLADVHIMLLKAILREEDAQGTHFGPLDQKDSINISLYLIDSITWPEVLRSYVESDNLFDRKVYEILKKNEYPYTSVKERIMVLQFLADQFLTTNTVRDVLLQEGPIHYDDHCRICHRLGKLLCCETCPAVYHLECVDPPLEDVPTEDWQCNLCKSHKVTGVVDCVLLQEKQGILVRHDMLGYDRHGRKFWFVARRIFVEDQNGKSIWYYSSIAKFELLMSVIDKTDLEAGLYTKLNERREEIVRQLKLTEQITNEFKQNKMSYIDYENQNSPAAKNSNGYSSDKEKSSKDNQVITRQKKNLIDNNMQYFKLGMENMFKSYVNQYSINSVALNKPQRNEERDKRRHLSHKFSLTAASDFKWNGSTMGSFENVISVLRSTIINFEQNIASPFLNPNWSHIKKLWSSAVTNCRTPKDFAYVLYLFQSSLKNVVFANVWHEQLGHISLQRITSAEREERKKIEKREKRERDEEEERNRLSINYIKYTLGLKHQVWKQRGEEYRVHGQWGWMWLSSNRRCYTSNRKRSPMLSIKPYKISSHYTTPKLNEVIAVDPRTIQFLHQTEISKQQGLYCKRLKKFQDVELQSLKDSLKHIGTIDVSKALTTPGRLLYPKIAKKCRLDRLLDLRERLKKIEEWCDDKNVTDLDKIPSELLNFPEETNVTKTFLEKKMFNLIETFKTPNVTSSNSNMNLDIVKYLAKKIQTVRFQFSQLNRFAKQYKCYTKECNTNSNAVAQITQNTCYSPLCLQKARAKKNLLILLRKAHAAGNGSKETVDAILGAVKKPSILEQKLTESRKENYSSYDDIDEFKWEEESPFDILVDWDQARSVAVPYDETLIGNCYTPFPEKHDSSSFAYEKEKLTSLEFALPESKMDFMENMEVCSNVEVESSENAHDDELEEMLMGKDTEEANSKKSKKALKNKHRTSWTATKDNTFTDVPNDESKINRENRRFPMVSRISKREEVTPEKEFSLNGKQKLYSAKSTAGKVYLRRNGKKIMVKSEKESENDEIFTKYPLVSNYLTHKGTSSILVLPRYELLKLARNGGKILVNGFNHIAKNNTFWPYPCSRPLFKTCWSYRTCNASTLSCVALQLRILWCCLRWDDMIAKSPSTDGKHQVTTENEIVTLELLKLQHCGRYGERTRYLRRKITVPLEMPKTIREVTSIRSGLRKRKRAESPQPAEPQTTEEWLEEEKLELWEIKYMGEKQEKSKVVTTTTRSSLRHIENVSSSTNSSQEQTHLRTKSLEDSKEKVEQTKIQRVISQKKIVDGVKIPQIKTTPSTRKVIVKNPDGTTRIIQHTVSPIHKAVSSTSNVVTSSSSNLAQASSKQQGTNSSTQQPHKVQIIRGPDGKVSVRGLNPGQQLIQMPDGKLHVFTTTLSNQQQGSQNNKFKVAVKQNVSSSSTKLNQATRTVVSNESKKIESPNGGEKIAPRILNTASSNNTSIGNNTPRRPSVQSVQSVAATVNKSGIQSTPSINTVQSTPKLLVHAGHQNQKVLIASPGTNTINQTKIISTGNGNYGQQAKQIQNNVLSIGGTNSQQSPTQKVIQQIVNTSNVQQQIMVGGQKIILSPGQTIVTQRSIPASSYPANNVGTTSEINTQTTKVAKPYTPNIHQAISTSSTAHPSNGSQNTSTNNQQIVVQNSTLAQQLAQGKLQVATINGQQVIIKPLGNNQAQIVAHIKTQSDGNAHIITANSPTENQMKITSQQSPNVFPNTSDCLVPEISPQPSNVNSTSSSQQSIEESLLQGQPPGTVIKCVTAQVVQTTQGPRIVLQGLVGNDFTQEQLTLVEQKVKQQLLKAQESSGKQNYLGPTKIYLAVQPPSSTLNSNPPPLTPVIQSSQQVSSC